MRKVDAALARSASPGAARTDRAARELVCLALIVAVAAILLRIISIW